MILPAQNSIVIDSLKSALSTTDDPLEKYEIYTLLSDRLIHSDIAKSLDYGSKAYEIAKESLTDQLVIKAGLSLAGTYYLQ